jgi:Secretion system C-terminal sorting domain
MYSNEPGKINKNSVFFTAFKLAVPMAFMGLVFSVFTGNHREYSSGIPSTKEEKDIDKGAGGMGEYFFTARKNITTNAMDYNSMLAADIADKAISKQRNTHAGTTTLPDFDWISMGPTNIGGRTRAILIDNNDATHQTIFAGGVSGGIWKSTNGGGTWGSTNATIAFSRNDSLENMNVCDIAQDANGAIYIGTGEGFSLYDGGEGFSSEMLGGGIFKSTDDGVTWRLLPATLPTSTNNAAVAWAFTNRIAIRPDSFKVVYAATSFGLYMSHDSGTTWSPAVNPSGTRLSGTGYNAQDVKISKDGSVIIACIGGYAYYCYPQSGGDNVFTKVATAGAGHLPGNVGRIEFAIAPSDPNRIYASVIQNSPGADPFQGNANSGIFMTKNAQTSGGYWYLIGPGGSLSFDPYAEPGGGDDQADYDNTLGVSPANEGMLLAGGTTMWQWLQLNNTDTIGSWNEVSHYYQYGIGDPLYIHPDEHAIVFDQNNLNTVYFGCDGGLFKCNNILDSADHWDIFAINRNYDVTQYYSVCFSPLVNYHYVNYGNSTLLEGLGLGGGTQDNGSPYITGNDTAAHPNDGTDLSGGDGAGSVVSSLNPNVAYFTSDYGAFERTSDLSTLTFPTSAYTQNYGYLLGADIDSMYQAAAGAGAVCFVMPCALYENAYDLLNHDSLIYVATKNENIGDTIWATDPNGPTSYPYVLTVPLAMDSSLKIPDRVVSRIAIGFSPSYGLWMNGQAASNNSALWMPIAYGSLSTPDAFSDGAPVHALAWTPDGDALFVGTEDGALYRISNINTIIANDYASGALWYKEAGLHAITTQVICTNMSFSAISGRDVLSISADPQDGNKVLVTVGNYGNTDYVFYSSNAQGTGTPTFTAVQGNLPAMPVYGCILDIDTAGFWKTNSAMVATEHGIYTTKNITATPVVWTKNSSGLPNVLTLAIKQQTLPPWRCNNSGNIYVGTHGRGLWSSGTGYEPTSVPSITTSAVINNLLVYPNPMTDQGNIEFNLAAAGNVTINIYDLQGRIIKTLAMGIQSAGNHIVTFNSSAFPAGAYFATLTGSDFRKVAKFIVTK